MKYVFNSYKKIYLENHERIDDSFYQTFVLDIKIDVIKIA